MSKATCTICITSTSGKKYVSDQYAFSKNDVANAVSTIKNAVMCGAEGTVSIYIKKQYVHIIASHIESFYIAEEK